MVCRGGHARASSRRCVRVEQFAELRLHVDVSVGVALRLVRDLPRSVRGGWVAVSCMSAGTFVGSTALVARVIARDRVATDKGLGADVSGLPHPGQMLNGAE